MFKQFEMDIVGKMSGTSYSLHESEFIYVVEGSVELHFPKEIYTLKRGDVILINSGSIHSWCKEMALTALCLRFDNAYICQAFELPYILFACNSAAGLNRDNTLLREKVEDLLYAYLVKENAIKLQGYFCFMIDCLIRYYMRKPEDIHEMDEDTQLNVAITYIHQNYSKKLALEDMGRLFYMSPSAFSRFFKKKSGNNFVDYVNKVRLQYGAERLLKNSDHLIVDIALDCGFGTSSAFNKLFKRYYGMTPSDYRKYMLREIVVPERSGDFMDSPMHIDALKEFIDQKESSSTIENGKLVRRLTVDTAQVKAPQRPLRLAVNVGEASELLIGGQQKHVLLLKCYLDMEYVRIVNIFSTALNLRSSKSGRRLNFDLLDNILDFLVENQIKVIVDLGDNRKVIVKSASDRLYTAQQSNFFNGTGDVTYVIDQLMGHLIMRYGKENVASWIFTVINVPEELETDSGRDSYELYSETVFMALKERLPKAQVGLYGKALGEELLVYVRRWKDWEFLPDFICVDALPYRRVRKSDGTIIGKRSMDPHFIRAEVMRLKQELEGSGIPQIKIMACEWNMNLSDRNYMNDSQMHGAQLLECLEELQGMADMVVHTYGSDLTVRSYETYLPLFGGKGLISKDGLIKPSCRALAFYQELRGQIIGYGDGYMLASDGNQYSFLCYNVKHYKLQYFQQQEDAVTPEMVKELSEDQHDLEFELMLTGLHEGCYTLKKYVLNSDTSVLHQWLQLGRPQLLTGDISDYLNQICVPRIQIETITVKNHELFLQVTMDAHSAVLVRIIKE